MRNPNRLLLLAALLAGCSSPPGASRSLAGTVMTAAYHATTPVVLAQLGDGRVMVAPVAASGAFHVKVAVGTPVRLLLADDLGGRYQVLSTLTWPSSSSRASWVRFRSGAVMNVGQIRPLGTALSPQNATVDQGPGCGEQGNNEGDHQNEDPACGADAEAASADGCTAADAGDSEADVNVEQEGEYTTDDGGGAAGGLDTQCGDQTGVP